jgi:SAM-dependent methyltransferase
MTHRAPLETTAPTGSATMSGALPQAVNYHRYIYRRLRPFLGARVWEIGAGHGQYTDMLLSDGRDVLATDIDAVMLASLEHQPAHDRLTDRPTDRLTVLPVDLLDETTIARCAAWSPDSVLCLNVLEHIGEDRSALQWLHRHLASRCRAVFLTPAHPVLYGFMDADAGQVRRYTRTTLEAAFRESGWLVERSFYMNAIGGAGWFVRNRIAPPATAGLDSPRVNADIRFFDRWLVPLTRALDPVFGRLFGQSVVVVATR